MCHCYINLRLVLMFFTKLNNPISFECLCFLWFFFFLKSWIGLKMLKGLIISSKEFYFLYPMRTSFSLHEIHGLFIVIHKIFLELFWTFPLVLFFSPNTFHLFPSEFLLDSVKLIQPRVHILRKRRPLWTVYQSASCSH